jgi:DNA-binding transcriptional MerR regulator
MAGTPMKMRDLERLTGVNRETIRVYLREGLLPEPDRPKPNVADYGEAHVRGILAIRNLQQERGLTLPQIKRAMAGDVAAMPADPSALQHLDALVAARLGADGARVPLASLVARNPQADADARALASVGAVTIRRIDGEPHLSTIDAQIVSLWHEMRAAGFTEERGFTPAITSYYVEAAKALADTEVSRFLAVLGTQVDAGRAADMARTAVDLMLPFFGLLRTKAVISAFARARGTPEPSPITKRPPARAAGRRRPQGGKQP